VQTIVPLPGHGAMRLTTARYFTPSGRSIQAVGIEPDIAVRQLKLADAGNGDVSRSEAGLRNSLRNGDAPANENAAPAVTPTPPPAAVPNGVENEGDAPPAAPGDAAGPATVEDYQLARALDILRGVALYRERVAAN
jgi:carboxyl-terminal processing protease